MDVELNEEKIEEASGLLENLPDQLQSLETAAITARNDVQNVGPESYFTDYTTSIDNCMVDTATLGKGLAATLGLLKESRSFEAGETTPIYDSYHGILNTAGWGFITNLFNGFQKTGDKAISKSAEKKTDSLNESIESYLNNGINSSAHEKAVTKEVAGLNKLDKAMKDKFGDKAEYDEDYAYGKDYRFGNFDLIKFGKKFSGELYGKNNETTDKYGGTHSESLRIGAADASASLSAGPDHVNLEASASFDGAKYERSYQSPALKTKDGLEVLSVGASGNVSVLHGEASVKAGFGKAYNKDTKSYYTTAGVSAQAELDIVKAEAQAQGTVMGVTATGSAAVKVGVGAKFDAGISSDGKIKFNLSVAAGLGFEVGFTLDFSKVNSYVTNKIKNYASTSFLQYKGTS